MKKTTMRKAAWTIALTAVASLLAMTATGSAASSTRTEEKEYTMSSGMIAGGSEAYWSIGTEYQAFRPRYGEKSVVFSATDAASPNVTIHVHYVSGHGKVKEGGSFCNKTKPLPVKFSHHFEVAVLIGECPGGDVSVATEGTITATFSK